jgi:hypothetical protein
VTPIEPQVDPLEGRVVRFNELDGHGTPLMFIDSVLPHGLRMNYALVGDVASENPDYEVLVKGDHTFQIAMFMNARMRPDLAYA